MTDDNIEAVVEAFGLFKQVPDGKTLAFLAKVIRQTQQIIYDRKRIANRRRKLASAKANKLAEAECYYPDYKRITPPMFVVPKE